MSVGLSTQYLQKKSQMNGRGSLAEIQGWGGFQGHILDLRSSLGFCVLTCKMVAWVLIRGLENMTPTWLQTDS